MWLAQLADRLQDPASGLAYAEQAVATAVETGDLHRESGALARLGDNHYAQGDLDAASHTWRQALTIMDNLGHPDAGKVSARLADPATTTTTVPIAG